MNKKTATLQDIANLTGVSVMTVSLALRDDVGAQRMAPETRARILEVAKELNYSPNARARALRLGKTNVFGLYAGHGYINVRSPFFTEVVSGLQEGCEVSRKDLLLHGVFHAASPETIFAELVDGRIDGLIVSIQPNHFLANRLIESRFPAIAIADAIPGIPSVVVEDAIGAALIVDHLAERGHRRLGYVMSPARPTSALRRQAAFLKRADELGLEVEQLNVSDELTEADLVEYALIQGISALACWTDTVAYAVLKACRRLQVSVPQELAIVGFDGCPLPHDDVLPITTVAAPWSQVAHRAVLLLDDLIKGKELAPETRLPVRLLSGPTS